MRHLLTDFHLGLLDVYPQLACALGQHSQTDAFLDFFLSFLSELQPVLLLPQLGHLIELFCFSVTLSSSSLLGLLVRHRQGLIDSGQATLLLDLLVSFEDLFSESRPESCLALEDVCPHAFGSV